MANYDIYPAVNENYEFPPAIRQGIAGSREVTAKIDSTLANNVTPTVERLAADYIASTPAIADAAAEATADAIVEADLISGADSRAPVEIESGSGWAHPFSDSTGRIVAGIDDNGVFHLSQPMVTPMDRMSRTKIACIGDSLVYGYRNGTDIDTWSNRLSEIFTDVEFTNAGYSGATTDEIRFRIGELVLYAEIPGGVVFANKPTPAIVKQKFGFGNGHEGRYYGYFAGIRGDIVVEPDGVTWTFQAIGLAQDTTIGKKKIGMVREDFYPNHIPLIWMGRNDVSFKAMGFERDVAKHVVASVKALVERLPPRDRRFGISTVLNQSKEVKGTANYEIIMDINNQLKDLFPSNIIDMQQYLVKRAIYDAGLTPTAADLDAISKDAPPPQIMDGGSHPLKFMLPQITTQFENFLNEKAYV